MDPETEALIDEDELNAQRKGQWALWTRGTNPRTYDPWIEATDGRGDNFGALLIDFMDWQRHGQHVRLEWVPNSAFGYYAR
jgi:hypothetical protein